MMKSISILVVLLTCGQSFKFLTPKIQRYSHQSKVVILKSSVSNSVAGNILLDRSSVNFSGLNGKALLTSRQLPTLKEVKASLPKSVWKKSDAKSLMFALQDIFFAALPLIFGIKYLLPTIPNTSALSLLNWSIYAIVAGTLTMGMWVTAHECGHGAFSENRKLQDFVGFVFHSILMVPYFSWQRSHQVHHANTNHIEDGETHVPPILNPEIPSGKKKFQNIFGNKLGNIVFGAVQLFLHLFAGWPAYLLIGSTGGTSRGITNHFIPHAFSKSIDPNKELFPKQMSNKVWLSDVGIIANFAMLAYFIKTAGLGAVMGLYGGPLLIINAWLVAYTWLQHTDVDVPHYPSESFSFIKGAFNSIDRPYNKIFGGFLDYLHHHIGSTHVVHHIDSTIPHYNAVEATEIVKETFPTAYLYDPTPIPQALWRLATRCYGVTAKVTVEGSSDKVLYVFQD